MADKTELVREIVEGNVEADVRRRTNGELPETDFERMQQDRERFRDIESRRERRVEELGLGEGALPVRNGERDG